MSVMDVVVRGESSVVQGNPLSIPPQVKTSVFATIPTLDIQPNTGLKMQFRFAGSGAGNFRLKCGEFESTDLFANFVGNNYVLEIILAVDTKGKAGFGYASIQTTSFLVSPTNPFTLNRYGRMPVTVYLTTITPDSVVCRYATITNLSRATVPRPLAEVPRIQNAIRHPEQRVRANPILARLEHCRWEGTNSAVRAQFHGAFFKTNHLNRNYVADLELDIRIIQGGRLLAQLKEPLSFRVRPFTGTNNVLIVFLLPIESHRGGAEASATVDFDVIQHGIQLENDKLPTLGFDIVQGAFTVEILWAMRSVTGQPLNQNIGAYIDTQACSQVFNRLR